MPSFQTDAQTPDKKPPFELIEDHEFQGQESVDVINGKDSQPFEAANQSFASEIDNKEAINTDTSEKKEPFLKRRRKIITVLAAFVVAAVAFGAGTLLNKEKDKHDTPNNIENNPIESNEVPSDVSDSAVITDTDITINSTESKNATETTQDPDSIEWFRLVWSIQSQELKDLNSMSVEEFRDQPLEDALLYYSFLNHVYVQTYSTGKYGDPEGSLATTKESASIDDSAEEIINQEINKVVLAYSAATEKGLFDKDEARKLISAQNYNLTEALADGDEYGSSALEKIFLKMPEDETPGITITDIDGISGISRTDAIVGDDGNYHTTVEVLSSDGKTYTMHFIFITFKNYANEDQSIWIAEDYTGKYSN